jgi:hypothetical protein
MDVCVAGGGAMMPLGHVKGGLTAMGHLHRRGQGGYVLLTKHHYNHRRQRTP